VPFYLHLLGGSAMKKLATLLFSLILSLALTACGQPLSTIEENTLVYGSGDYTRINPALDEHGEINILLFDGLTAHGEDNAISPRLAEHWDIDEATNTYTFYLREDVKWHDGQDFTAEDVKFTIEAIMNPENGSENASNYEDIEAITIIDPFTIAFRLAEANYAFLDYMTIPILPQHLLEGEDMQTSDFFRAPIGTGPYKLTEWEPGQSITLEKNQDYFLGAANIDTIIFKIITDDTARALQLQTGELDLAQLSPKSAAIFDDTEGYSVYQMTTSDYRGIMYNFRNDYWQKNADLIPAINYAIDRQAIIDGVLLGKGEIAYGPLQRNQYNYENVEQYSYNPDRAKTLLEQLGCQLGEDGYYYRDGEKLGFVINASADDQVRIDMAMIAAQQLQEIGLDVQAEITSSIDWGGQECCIIGWGSPFDADDHTYKVFGTDKGANYSGYSNPLVDQYLTQARQNSDPVQRQEAYTAFQIELAKNPPYTFFCYIDALYVAEANIQGIDRDSVLGHHGVGIFWNICQWSLEEAAL